MEGKNWKEKSVFGLCFDWIQSFQQANDNNNESSKMFNFYVVISPDVHTVIRLPEILTGISIESMLEQLKSSCPQFNWDVSTTFFGLHMGNPNTRGIWCILCKDLLDFVCQQNDDVIISFNPNPPGQLCFLAKDRQNPDSDLRCVNTSIWPNRSLYESFCSSIAVVFRNNVSRLFVDTKVGCVDITNETDNNMQTFLQPLKDRELVILFESKKEHSTKK